jgi:hypothetical protein
MITEDEDNPITKSGDLNGIFTLKKMIELLNYNEYNKFLIRMRITPNANTFNGFVFMVKTISRCFLDQIGISWSLNLQEDFTLSRAKNRGVPLNKIKNTCEKTIFLKNAHKILKKWWKAGNETELGLQYELIKKSLLIPIQNILEKNVTIKREYEKFGKEEILRRLAIDYMLVYLMDARRGFPMGYFFSLLPTNLSRKYLSGVFEGYKFSLMFLLNQLIKRRVKKEKAFFSELVTLKNWRELDSKYRVFQNIFVTPLEKEFSLGFGLEEYFEITKAIDPKSFDETLFKKSKTSSLSLEEDLQQALFWYPVQAMKGSYVFNGVATFSSLLSGTVTLKRLFGNNEKSYVARFVHPQQNGNDYSYGILIEAFGTLADYSGWIIFYDCAADYSGFSGSEYRYAESIIERYNKLGSIEIIEYRINSKAFLNYLTVFSAELTEAYHPFISKIPTNGEVKKHRKILENISLASIVRKKDRDLSIARGILLELVAYYYFKEKSQLIHWRYTNPEIIEDREIDLVFVDFSSTLTLVSCMCKFDIKKLDNLVDEAKKFEAHKKELKQQFGKYNEIKKIIFVPKKMTPKQLIEAEKRNIIAYTLETLLRDSNVFSKVHRNQLEQFFELLTKKPKTGWKSLFPLGFD